MEKKEQGIVFDIYRGSTHDGPGVRNCIFMKGCPLSCEWCHNPESIHANLQLLWNKKKCIGCNSCVTQCPTNAISFGAMGIHIEKDICNNNYKCSKVCPAKALAISGKYYKVETLIDEICKDEEFFKGLGGGVTISGGEPLVQSEFVLTILKELKNRNIHTALDTSGMSKWECIEKLLPYVDLLLYDIKLIDSSLHQKFTGVDNALILQNLQNLLKSTYKKYNYKIWIRTPLIPEITATSSNINAIGKFLSNYDSDIIEQWEMCAFNNVCVEKYDKLCVPWKFKDTPLMRGCEVINLQEVGQKYMGSKVQVSGLTRN